MVDHLGPHTDELRRLAFALARGWGVELGAQLRSKVHLVMEGHLEDGTACVLKLAPPGAGWLGTEARALELQAGRGAVRLLDSTDEAILVERAAPGVPLGETFERSADDRATEIIAGLMSSWSVPLSDDDVLEPVTELRRDLEGVSQWLASWPSLSDDGIVQLAEEAADLLDELSASAGCSVLLHGDLHHDNVLSAGERGYLAIDPHGRIGDPGFEVGQLLLNPLAFVAGLDDGELAAVTGRRLARVAAVTGADRERLAAWGFVKAVISEAWTMEDGETWPAARRLAALLRP